MKTSGQPSLLRICVLIVMFLSYSDTYVFSKPRGGQVVSGTASFTQDGNLTVITAGNRSVINYQSFDIGKNETVQFVQPNASSTVLNRVLTPDPTNIFGHLEANGIVVISNPYGVFFQNGSVVNVGGLIAGAGKISDADFTAGKIHFTDLTGDVRNDGVVAADNRIALMGANVVNTGSLTAARGVAMMVSGPDVYVGEKNGNIFVQANGKALKAAAATTTGASGASAGGVTNSGTVAAPRVVLGAGDMYSTAIVNSGLLQGRSVAVNAGRNGSATISGKIDATSASNRIATGTGGSVDVLGGTIALKGATVDASGDLGGGSVRVGGDFHGAPTVAASATTTVDAASTVRADATGATGNGGTVVLWSSHSTEFDGNISARGGAAGGNGGSVEVSSVGKLAYQGFSDLRATAGNPGALLLDPANYVIDTTSVDAYGYPANTSILVATVLATQIAAGPVTLGATNDIVFRTDVPVLTANTSSLTLNAGHSIYIGDPGTNPLGATISTPPATNAALSLNGASFTAAYNSTGAAAGVTNARFRMSGTSSITTPNTVMISDGGVNAGNTPGIFALNITTSNSAAGAAGNIVLDTSLGSGEPVSLAGATLTASGSGGVGTNTVAGNVTVTASGAITGAGTITANGTGTGKGGAIALTANGDIATGDLTARGRGTGVGGSVSLTSSTTAASGTAAGAFSTGNLDTSSNGAAGGSITIGTPAVAADIRAASVTLNGTFTTAGSTATTGGAIDLETTGALTFTGNTTPSFTGNTTLYSTTTNAATYTPNGYNFSLTLLGAPITSTQIVGLNTVGGVNNLTLTDPGAINISQTTVTTAGSQTYNGPVLLNSGSPNVSLTAGTTTAASNIVFGSTLTDSPSGTHNLTLTTGSSGGTSFSGAVGTLLSLTATAATTGATTVAQPVTLNGVSVTTTAAQSYGTLTLGASPNTLNGTTITSGAVNGGGFALTVNGTSSNFGAITNGGALVFADGAGLATFTGNIGAVSLNSTGSGGVTFSNPETVTTSGAAGQSYAGTLTLGGATTLTANGGGTVTAGPVTGGGFNLSVNASGSSFGVITNGGFLQFNDGTGAATFSGNVTGTAFTAGAVTFTNPATLTATTGDVNLTGLLTLGGATTITSTAGDVNGSTVAGGGFNLTVNAAGAAGTAASTFSMITNGGALVFNDTAGTANFTGNIGAVSLNSTGAGGVTFGNALSVTTSGAAGQSYTGALTLGGATTLTANNGGNVTAGSVTGGGFGLSVMASGSTFGAITNGGVLIFVDSAVATFNGAITATSLTVTGGTGVTLAAGGTAVTTTGAQNYNEPLTLTANTILTGQGSAATGGIALLFGSTISSGAGGPYTLTLTNTASGVAGVGSDTVFNGAVGTLAGLTTSTVGTTFINGVTVTTVGATGQTYNGAVLLGVPGATTAAPLTTTLSATGAGANILFKGTVDGNAPGTQGLIANATGNETFIANVGAGNSLASLTTDNGGSLGGSAIFGGTGTVPPVTVTTTGLQSYNDGVLLAANTVLNAGSIAFVGALNGSASHFNLTLDINSDITLTAGTDTGVGAGRISGVLHNIGNFVSNGTGNIFINGEFETYGSQEFDNHAYLNNNTEFRSDNNSTVTFSALDSNLGLGYYTLSTVTTGTTTFTGQVGAARALTGVTVPGPAAFNFAGTAVQTLNNGTNGNGAQSYGATTLSLDTTLASTFTLPALVGGSIAFTSTVDGAHALTLNTTGATSFTGAVGTLSAGSALTSLTIAAGSTAGTTVSGGAVKTTGAQTYNSPLTIGTNNLTLTTGGGAVTFNSTVGGPFTLTTATGGGNTVFGANSGSVAGSLLTGLTTSASGSTIFNDAAFTTNGTQNYQGPAVVQSNTRSLSLTANTGNIIFGNTLGSTAANSSDLTLLTSAAGSSVTFTGAVGGSAASPSATALNSLTVTSPTININGGVVNTASTNPRGTANDGKQIYNGAVVLGADTTFVGTSAAFNGGLSESTANAYDLTLNLSTQVTLPGTAPLSGVRNFSSIGSGGVLINNNVSTYGSQTYSNGPVTIGATLTLTAGTGIATSGINLNAPLDDSADFAHTLTLTTGTSGIVTIGGAVGAMHPLVGLLVKLPSTAPGPVTINAQTVRATTQSYGALTLGGTGATTLTSTQPGGSITAGAVTNTPVGTGHALTVSVTGTGGTSSFASISDAGAPVEFEVAGVATFTGTIAASSFALGLTTAGTRGVFSGGGNTVTTSAGQTYNEPIQLAADTILADSGSSAISLKTITTDGTARALITSTGGTTTFGGPVGTAGAPLSTLTAGLASPNNLGGTTQLNVGGGIFTNGAQTYNDFVTLGATDNLSAGTGAVTFAKTLQSAGTTTAQALTINTTGVTTFGGAVGGTPGAILTGVATAPALASLAVTGGGTVAINGGSITTVSGATGTQQYSGPIVLGGDTLLQGYSATFGGAFTSAANAGAPFNLTLDFFGAETLPGGGTFAGVRNLLVEGPGGTSLSGAITTQGNQRYVNGLVTLTGNTTLTAGSTISTGSITLDSSVVDGTPGAHSLTLVTGTAGGVAINAPIGGGGAALGSLTAQSRTTNGSAPTTDEPVTINATSVTTTGSQTYGALILGGTGLTTLTSTATTGAVGINSGPVTGGGNPLTVSVASVNGTSTFGTITGAGALNFTVGGTVNFSGIGATTVNVAAGVAANFNGTVNATDILSSGAGTTAFNAAVTANSLTVTNGTSVTLNLGGLAITTTGEQNYNEPALLGSAATLTGKGTSANGGVAVRFGSTLGGDFALTLSNTASGVAGVGSDTVFAGAVGTLLSLNASAVGTTQINGGSIVTNGAAGQVYNGPVTLGATGATTTLTASNAGPVNFVSTLQSAGTTTPQALTINTTGVTTFNAPVGGTPGAPGTAITTAPALASLTTTSGEVDIKGSVTTVTSPGGVQNYGGPVKLLSDGTLEGYSLSLGSGLSGQTGAYSLTLDFTSRVALPSGIVGLNNFTTVGFGGVSLNGGTLSTVGTQTYSNGTVSLVASTTLTSTTAGLLFNTPIDGNASLTLNALGAGGTVTFATGAQIGNNTTIGTLTSNTAAGTLFDMNATVKGGVNAAAVATTGPVTFFEAGASSAQPDVLTTGTQTYNSGAVTLNLNTFLTSTGTAATGAISFGTSTGTAATIDSLTGFNRALTLSTLGTQTFYGLLGSTTALGGLTTGSGPTVFDMTIPTTNPAVVAAGVRVNGAVVTGGPATFNVPGSNLMQPTVLTLGSGAQTYGTLTNPVGTAVTLLGAVTVLNSANTEPTPGTFSGGGSVIFNGNIVAGIATPELDVRAGLGTVEFDSPIYTTGDFAPGGASVIFRGAIGTTANPLGVFTVQPNPGSTGTPLIDLNGSVVVTGGLQNYAFPTVLSAPTVLTATGNGTITFGSTLDGSNLLNNTPYTLTINVNGGTVAFNGIVGGITPLQSLTVGNVGATLGTARFAMNLTGLGANQGGVNVLGPVVITTNADFEATGGTGTTPTILSGVTYLGVTGPGTQTYGQTTTAAAVTVGQNTVLQDLASGAITFNGRVNAATDGGAGLTVDTGGDELFQQLVGNLNRLASLSTDAQGTVGGTTRFNMDLTQAGTVAGVRLSGALNVNDRVAFNATPSAALPTILSGGAQSYALAATVRTNTVLTATGGNIAFSSAVDSGAAASALTVNTPNDEVFNGLVGATAPLTSLTTDATGTVGGTTRFVLTLPATGLAAGVGGVNTTGVLTLNDGVLFQVANTSTAHPSIVSGGTQTYNGAATLGAATILTSTGGSIVFASTVNSDGPTTPRDLTTNTPTAGSFATFAQTVGGTNPLASLTTNGGGTTQINGGITANPTTIRTTGSQEYLQAVTLGADASLNAGGNVDFGNVANGNVTSSLDGSHSLTVNAAAVSFEEVGNNAPLVNLTVTGPTTFNYVPALVSAGNAGVNLAGALTLNSPAVFNGAGTGSVVLVRTGVTVVGVTAASSQDYFGAVTFSGTGTFTDLKSGAITYHQAVDALSATGLSGLTVSTGGTVSFLGPVGATTPLTGLTTSNLGLTTGRTVIGGGSITTINKGTAGATGAQTYNDAVFLSADATLTSTAASGVAAGGDIMFALTLDSLSTAQSLTVNTSGQTIFSGAVGGTSALSDLTTDAPGITRINGGSVKTVGFQSYQDAVTLGGATTLTSTVGQIIFAKTLDSATAATPEPLTIKTGGEVIFGGTVGAANPLASLTVNTGIDTQINGGSVTTTGAQTYNDTTTIGANTVLTSTANGTLSFNGRLDGAFTLSLKTGGLTVFNQPVGNATALAGLTTDAPGSTQFNMPVGGVAGVVVNGPVTINDPVSFAATGASLTVPTILTTGSGSQTYAGAVSLSTNTFLVSAGGGLPFTGGGSVAFTSPLGIASTGGSDLYVRAGVGTTTVNAAISANTVDLGGAAVTFAGPVTLPGTVSVEPNGGVGSGSILFNGGTITTAGAQVYNVPFVLDGNTILASTGGGSITFNAALDGAFNLTLNSTGDEVFNGQVGGTTPLASLTTDDPAAVQPGGRVIFAFAGTTASPSVKTTGAQTYNDAAFLRADTVLASTGGTITFNRTVDGAQALTLNAAGDEVFNGRVGGTTALTSLVTDDAAGTISGGHVVFNIANSTTAAPGVTTTGAQTYNDAAVLSTNTVLASTGAGTLTFKSTVDGARTLTLNTAGDEVFDGAVGGTTALTSLVTDDPAANSTGGHVVFNVPGTGRSVTTTGAQTYNDAVTLLAGTKLASTGGGALTFKSAVDGAQALTLNTSGLTTFGAPVGGGVALASLTTSSGPVAINGGVVTTTGAQSYGGAVVLGADTTLTSQSGGALTFSSTLDSDAAATPRALTISTTGVTTFQSVVGATPLASLSTGNGNVAINGGAVTTTGAQSYGGAVTLGANTTLTSQASGDITFNFTLDSDAATTPRTLTLNAVGDEVFGGIVGGTAPLASLVTNSSAGRVVFGITDTPLSLTTTGDQTYNNAVLLQADTTLNSNGGSLTFNSTIDAAVSGKSGLTLNAVGDEMLNGRIGGGGALSSFVTDADKTRAGGNVDFRYTDPNGGPSVTTTGDQTYNDAAVLQANTLLSITGTTGTLTFGSTVDSSSKAPDGSKAPQFYTLTLNTPADVVFDGLIGAKRLIGDLVTNTTGPHPGTVKFNLADTGGKLAVNVDGRVTINEGALFNAPDGASLTVQSTGAQVYNGVVALGKASPNTSTVLTSASAPITLASTVDGPGALTVSTAGTTTIANAVGSVSPLASLTLLTGGSGNIALNANLVRTDGNQLYDGPVTLRNSSATIQSNNGGIDFTHSVTGGASNLILTTTGDNATTFEQPVNVATLTTTANSAVVINGGNSITTSGLQNYGGPVTVSGTGTTLLTATNPLSSTDGAQSGNVILQQVVNVVGGGSLTVSGQRILAGSDITVEGAGNLDLEANDLLILAGANYTSDSGAIRLNASVPAPANGSRPNLSIIVLNPGATTRFRGGSFSMGYLQNLFAQGSIAINAGSGGALLSDIDTVGSLTVTSPVITLFARQGDQARGGSGGGTDDGLNFVAGTSINFGQSTPINYNTTYSDNRIANFVTPSGLVTVNRNQQNGISIFQDPAALTTLRTESDQINEAFRSGGGAGAESVLLGTRTIDVNAGTFNSINALISGGTQTIDTAAALSGALPDQKPLDVAVDITISASQIEELIKLGIHPRKAQKQERLSLASKRALFAQLVDGLDKDNYGRLQPIKGGISTLVPSDYVVVVDRMSEHEVQDILTAFENLYGKNKEKAPPIGEAFNTAFTDYSTEKQTADPAGYAPYIAAHPGKYPDVDKAVRGFDNLFGYIEHLGLTEKEQAKAKEHIASDLQVSGVSAVDMVKAIDTLRAKIPKDQKAPSTKLPPSAPAGNPAPGSTSPGQPEQKKGTPPLKTASEDLPQEVAAL